MLNVKTDCKLKKLPVVVRLEKRWYNWINNLKLQFSGIIQLYKSIDILPGTNMAAQNSMEFFKSFKLSGVHSHNVRDSLNFSIKVVQCNFCGYQKVTIWLGDVKRKMDLFPGLSEVQQIYTVNSSCFNFQWHLDLPWQLIRHKVNCSRSMISNLISSRFSYGQFCWLF